LQVNKALERALATLTRAYAQLYTTQKSVIAPAHENYHDLLAKALENHQLYTAHEHLKQDILFMEQLLLTTNIAM
jgi:hypothetical protein